MKRLIRKEDIQALAQLFIAQDSRIYFHDLKGGFELPVFKLTEKQVDYVSKSLIIAGEDDSSYDFSDFESVIQFGSSKSQTTKHHKSFRYIKANGAIRWVYPKGQLNSIYDFYNASTFRGKVIKLGLKVLGALRLDGLVSKELTVYGQESVAIQAIPENTQVEDFSLFMGTPGIERTVLISMLNNQQSTHFVKVGLNVLSAKNIGNERNVLYRLSHTDLKTCVIPKSLSTGARNVVTLSKLDASRKQFTFRFTEKHAKTLIELNAISKMSQRFDQSMFGELVTDQCAMLRKSSENQDPLVKALLRNFNAIPHDLYFTTALSHGDFTPWNMFIGNNKLYLYDWEMAQFSAPVLFDLFHYHFQTGIYLKNWSFDQIYTQINRSVEQFPGLRSDLNRDDLSVERYMQMYLLFIVSKRMIFQKVSESDEITSAQRSVWQQALNFTASAERQEEVRVGFMEEFNFYLGGLRHSYLKFNAANLKEVPATSDLDIAIHRNDLKKAVEFCQEYEGVKRCKVIRKSFMTTLQLYFKGNEYLSIDLIHDFKRKWVRFMNIEHLLRSSRRTNQNIVVPDLRFDVEYAMMFYTLNGARVPEKYVRLFTNGSPSEKRRTLSYFKHKYGLEFNRLEDLLLDFEGCQQAFKNQLSRGISTTLKTRINEKLGYASDVIRELIGARGFILTVSGVDGVGKTTIIESIKDQVQAKYRKEVVLLRHRPRILPILSALKHGSVKEAEEKSLNTNPGVQASKKSALSSYLRFSYYYLDYFFGQFYVHIKYVWRGKIVLYDRYYFDLINNPERTNLKVNRKLAKGLYRGIMKPSLNIFLCAPAEDIVRRKQELDLPTINRLTSGYLNLFGSFSDRYSRSRYIVRRNEDLQNTITHIMDDIQQVA